MDIQRQCSTCKEPLVLDSNWTEAQYTKKNYKCNSCRASYQREYHKNNKEERNLKQKERYETNKTCVLQKQKSYYIQKTFNLSTEEYGDYMERPCTLCGAVEDLVLDHCHKSGKVRNTLCRKCNMALGLFNDDPALLEKARRYIIEHS